MTKEKRALYKKAYVELYELIKMLSVEERVKIPEYFINYLYNHMDTNYNFIIDNEKGLLEQGYMIETKALIVKIYERYFAPESEKEFWNDYHKLCSNMIELQKKKNYNQNDLFDKNNYQKDENCNKNNETNLHVELEKVSFLDRIVNFFRGLLK